MKYGNTMEHAIHKWNGNKIKSEELTAAANGEVESDPSPKDVDLSLWIPTTKRLTNDFSISFWVSLILLYFCCTLLVGTALWKLQSQKNKSITILI